MVDKQNSFGKELRRLRKSLQLRQDQLAELAGISAAYISQLETGKKNPTDRVITKLCGALDIPENRLLIKIGKMKMDLAATLATRRKKVPTILRSLTDDQLEELLTYIAYIKVRASIKD
jgi:transcriptional regulator with XRE-family HTH domain